MSGPLPTNQFYFSAVQRPLGADGRVAPIHAHPGWFNSLKYSSGFTGAFDRAYYQISPLPGINVNGHSWTVEIIGQGAANDNSAHNRIDVYVPVGD